MIYIEETAGVDVAERIVDALLNPLEKTEIQGCLSDIDEILSEANTI